MNDHPILGQVVLGYSPMIDRARSVMATRLTVFPVRPDLQVDAAELLAAVAATWPEAGGKVVLNIAGEQLLAQLLTAAPAANLMVEVPAFMAGDEGHTEALLQLYGRGNTLLIKGVPLKPLPQALLACFRYAIVDLTEDRRAQAGALQGAPRAIPVVQSGIRTVAQMGQCLQRPDVIAVLGWPVDDVLQAGADKGGTRSDMQTVVELMQRVDKGEPGERMEATLKRDPTLAFKLMRYINSPAFGLSVEISSFRHALMMLGYQRLKRWLALLLASASQEPDMRPVMFAAVRRGLLMEELSRAAGGDDELRSEAFICGVFSLLDKMMRQPFAELLKSIPVPERVHQALVQGQGPFQPHLEVVRAVEQESLFDIRAAADQLMMSVQEVNRALLRALAAAAQLD
jgi:EAL and modified HD-GYP domain-containing signal transduction protein